MGAKVLCRFEKIAALEVVTGNVNVGSLPTINCRKAIVGRGRCRGARLRSPMRSSVLILVRSMLR